MSLDLNHLAHEALDGAESVPLLIAHGLYGSARNFNSLGKRLARDRPVIMVDMRNHGESPWNDEMTYAAMAHDLARAIERECDGRAAVLGHSMGGKAAMALALTRPDLVSALMVADIAPVAYDHSHDGYISAMQQIDLSQVRRRSDADPMLAGGVDEPMLRSFLLQNLLVEGGQARWRLNLDALEAALPELMSWPSEWPEPAYEGPCLFIHGTASDYVEEAAHPRIRALFPDVTFAPIAGAGHWLHAEAPEAFLATVSEFLAAVPRG
ncbi:MAG: alpha/beta fold hydrolase [Pseudomonadota bacterium]